MYMTTKIFDEASHNHCLLLPATEIHVCFRLNNQFCCCAYRYMYRAFTCVRVHVFHMCTCTCFAHVYVYMFCTCIRVHVLHIYTCTCFSHVYVYMCSHVYVYMFCTSVRVHVFHMYTCTCFAHLYVYMFFVCVRVHVFQWFRKSTVIVSGNNSSYIH